MSPRMSTRPVRSSKAAIEPLESRLLLSSPSLNDSTPWGVGSSAEASGQYNTFMPRMAQAGIKWIRTGFSFGQINPAPDTWDWTADDAWMNAVTANGLYASGLLCYNTSWINPDTRTFPLNNLPAWQTYVSNVVNRYRDRISYWEIWNEPENFAPNETPAGYGTLVAAAYDAIKAADPSAQVGMSVASVDIPYLEQAILGDARDHFDYIVVHPYEMFGTMDYGQEAEYLSIVPTIRKMLRADNPARADAPVWVTEIGTPTGGTSAQQTTAAQQLVKGYTMGIAQGFAHIEWFDAMAWDPYNMGLLTGSGAILPAYTAYQNMITRLGTNPQYLGWVQLNGRDYGFVFQGATSTVLVTWAPPGATDTVNFGASVSIMNPVTGSTTTASSYSLTNAPVFVWSVPSSLVAAARFNKGLAFPWGGDYTGAQAVSANLGATNIESGLHQLNANGSSIGVIVNGVSARDCSQAAGQAFTVDPNFLSYDSANLLITILVRRKSGTGTVPGFNLKYEGPTGWAGGFGWYNVPYNSSNPTQWYTKTWTLTTNRFVGTWAYNFRLDSDSTTYSAYYLQSVTVTNLSSATAAPTSISLTPASDSGIAGDNTTSLNNSTDARKLSFTILGTLAGARVYLYAGSNLLGSAIAAGASTLITTDGFSPLPDGSYSLTAKQALSPRLLSAATPAAALTIDSSIPSVPATPVLRASSDSGVSSSDRITKLTTLTFDLAAAPYFRFYRDGILVSGSYQSGSSYTLTGQPTGTHAYTATAIDAAGNESAPSPAQSITIDTTAPGVTGVVIYDGTAQRSMARKLTLSFNEPVTLAAGALLLQQHGGGPLANIAADPPANPSGDGRTYDLSFSGPAIVGGSLPDGTYDLVAKAALSQDAAGNAMAGDYTFSFLRLFGDATGDGYVDNLDLARLRPALNQPARYVWYFDSNTDGLIDNLDLAAFRRRLGSHLLLT